MDSPIYNFLPYFEEITALINQYRLSKLNIFVHCHMGISRSCTIVIAYLLRYENMSYKQAFDLVSK
jgi:dual specificity MAP kinase phosphatase